MQCVRLCTFCTFIWNSSEEKQSWSSEPDVNTLTFGRREIYMFRCVFVFHVPHTTCLLFSLQKHKPNGTEICYCETFICWIVLYACCCFLTLFFYDIFLSCHFFYLMSRSEMKSMQFFSSDFFSSFLSFFCIFRINEWAWMKSDAIQAWNCGRFSCVPLVSIWNGFVGFQNTNFPYCLQRNCAC